VVNCFAKGARARAWITSQSVVDCWNATTGSDSQMFD